MKKKLLKLLKTLKNFFVNPHLVICFAIAWIITNGWAYASLVLGTRFGIKWLTVVAGAYIAVLYSPLCGQSEYRKAECRPYTPEVPVPRIHAMPDPV